MPTNLKPQKEDIKNKSYNPTGDELEVWLEYQDRKKELLESRKSIKGLDIDEQMRTWDSKYFNRTANIPASELDPDQKPVAINNAFAKMQTALSILIDRSPDFILDEKLPQYSANNEIIRALLKKSWQRTDSLYQFGLFVFNMAKRGWGVGRTYHCNIEQDARFRISKKGKEAWETRPITKRNDIAFVNLDNFNTWIDEEARPFDFFSIRDWMWREVLHIDKVKRLFPEEEFPNMKFVNAGGNVQERIDGMTESGSGLQGQSQRELKKGMTEVFYYENQFLDRFIVEVNGVMVLSEPLPQYHKRLSLVTAPWNLRSAEDIYGIGLLEEMEKDEVMVDRILNMTMRQMLLSISPMGFYNGTDDFEKENLVIKPNVIRRVQGDPSKITFVKVSPPDKTSMEMIDWLENKEEQNTGITKTLAGEIDQLPRGETAFAMGISREAGLKRLKIPLKSLQYAFSWEAKNRADLIKQVYSDKEVERIVDPKDIKAYLDEISANPQLYFIENEGQAEKESFYAIKYPQEKLSLNTNDKGEIIESEDKRFFQILPQMLAWEGDIWIDINSMLVQSEELEKVDTVRMVNLLAGLSQLPPELFEKWSKQILGVFNKDPKKWLPENMTEIMAQFQQQQQQGSEGQPGSAPSLETAAEKKVGLGQMMGAAYNTAKEPA